MPIATWNTFKENYTENKPEEERTIQKALEHFNKFAIKPFSIVQQQDCQNHREMLHDAKLSNGETTIKIEAKTDHVSRHSGNFFIEYIQYGKASGIAITDADYYVISDTINYWMVDVGDLNELIADTREANKLKIRWNRNKDGMVTTGYVLKKTDVLEFATVL